MPNASIPVRPLFFNAMTAAPELPDDTPAGEPSPAPEVWRRALPWLAAYAALQIFLRLVQLPPAAPRAVIFIAGLLVSGGIIVLSSAAPFPLLARTPPRFALAP